MLVMMNDKVKYLIKFYLCFVEFLVFKVGESWYIGDDCEIFL